MGHEKKRKKSVPFEKTGVWQLIIAPRTVTNTVPFEKNKKIKKKKKKLCCKSKFKIFRVSNIQWHTLFFFLSSFFFKHEVRKIWQLFARLHKLHFQLRVFIFQFTPNNKKKKNKKKMSCPLHEEALFTPLFLQPHTEGLVDIIFVRFFFLCVCCVASQFFSRSNLFFGSGCYIFFVFVFFFFLCLC